MKLIIRYFLVLSFVQLYVGSLALAEGQPRAINDLMSQKITETVYTLRSSSLNINNVLTSLSQKITSVKDSCDKDKKTDALRLSKDTLENIDSMKITDPETKNESVRKRFKVLGLKNISFCRQALFASLPFFKRHSNAKIIRGICEKASLASQCLKDMAVRAEEERRLHEGRCKTDPEYYEVNLDDCESEEDAEIMSEG